ncbi:MAG TPA: deoxyuridine 5'-triphosphate nucleotidohydrolase [Dehalococcoidia bacterium]|nr:deoxyuridine 5'-triphosphate nucleotidohydrolase [Dehalococcoidia bacterium]
MPPTTPDNIPGLVLGKESLLRLLAGQPPLVEELVAPEAQVQPNGIDLTVREVALLGSSGQLGDSEAERRLSQAMPLTFDALGWVDLPPGTYLLTFNEIVNLPQDIMALGRTRSSLLRCGVALHTAVWDAGYSGRSQALLTIYNPYGFRLRHNARVLQLVFFRLTEPTPHPYQGIYQGENK